MRRFITMRAWTLALTILSALVPGPGPRRAEAQPAAPQMIIVLDPSCPHAETLLGRLREFRRLHPEVPIRLLAPDLGAFARTLAATLTALQHADLTFEWDPPALWTLGITATPAVVVLDARGQGVRAVGSPDLAAVLDAARGR